MEVQLQSLIDTIKREAVDEAERQATIVRKRAELESAKTIEAAKQEAVRIIAHARESAARIEDAGKKALEQAARNLILGLRTSITTLFDRLLRQEIRNSQTSSLVASMLEKIAEQWDHSKQQKLETMLNPADLNALEQHFHLKLREELRKGVLLKPVDTIGAGFLIGEQGRNTFYDFTDAGIARILSQYLNPRLSALLKELETRPADAP